MAENSLNDEIAKALNSSIGDENPVIQEEPNNEYDINDSNQSDSSETTNNELKETASFLKISELKLKCRGKNLRLKEDDIIVAIDGKPFHGTILEMVNILSEENKKSLLTIKRKDVLFEIIAYGPLGTSFKFTSPEETLEVEKSLENHQIFPIGSYQIYEILRDLRRKVDILDTNPSFLAWFLPPVWLIQHKLWEVLMVTISVYFITLSIAWWVFAITWVLLAIYFNKGQVTILRSFSIYRDNHFWLILAAPDENSVQKICKQLDPKCSFDFQIEGLENNLNDQLDKNNPSLSSI